MKTVDLLVFTGQSLGRHTFRSAMMLLSMAVGVAAVVVLTGLGEGARSYVLGQFSFLGTDTVVVLPGKKETTGGLPPMMGTAARDITLSDAETIGRMVSGIKHIAPLLMGTAPISFASRSRETLVVGTTRDFFAIRQLEIARGQALPEIPLQTSKGLAVIGQTVQHELFGSGKVIGEFVRVGDRRFRVIGVIKGRGDAFGRGLTGARQPQQQGHGQAAGARCGTDRGTGGGHGAFALRGDGKGNVSAAQWGAPANALGGVPE